MIQKFIASQGITQISTEPKATCFSGGEKKTKISIYL